MRLKRLEIRGFKTFASPVALEFDSPITAVVGPNGSGKSNIADAVRWVLGEQSARALRTKKTEDVIFAGGAGRAQLGMAEVTLTLDNETGWLDMPYAEVAITRRAYRSGENEYLLNGGRVRLRDLNDMLLRANAGTNSYTSIGQGMVDLVLSLRPEERR
ncbi:MAG: AAA family ATPase, partial [Chloroflexota bacterium]